MHEEEGLDLSRVVTFNLDEYVGLPPAHPQSYRYFMNENLFNHINIRMENTHVPNGSVDDLQKSCREFEELIKEFGGIELQLLGIGPNGHIGFNEPGSSFNSRTRAVDISEQTRKRNAGFFSSAEEVPPRAITMGIETIMEAEKIILLASGERKRDIVAKSVEGPITKDVPASILQKHPNCLFLLDKAAASKLTHEKVSLNKII